MILFFYTLFFCTCLLVFRLLLNRLSSSFAYHWSSSKIPIKKFFPLWFKIQLITSILTASQKVWNLVSKLPHSENVVTFNILFPLLMIYFIYVYSLFDFSKVNYGSKDFNDFNQEYISDKKRNIRDDKIENILG